MLPAAYILASLLLALLYAALQLAWRQGWQAAPEQSIPAGYVPRTRISVLVPARNEAARIAACLESIRRGSYPAELYDITVIDDHSDDDTAGIALRLEKKYPMHLRLLPLSELQSRDGHPISGKKQALTAGVVRARGELIVTTDADCLVPPDWLLLLAALYEAEHPDAIAGPVLIEPGQSAFQYFQALDLAGMMGITGAGIRSGRHHMGNGAHLAFTKAVFEAVGGYAGSEAYASGDDLFLLQKIARRRPGSIRFLKNPAAAVRTVPQPDLRAFFRQRLRWGSKSTALPETGAKAALGLVFLCCCSILLNVLCGLWYPILFGLAFVQLALKAAGDFLLLRTVCRYFGRERWMRWFWPALFMHTAYVAVLGLASLFVKRYVWKGRRLR